MSDEPKKCSNDDCDACHPLPRWKVTRITVRRIAHEREIKAATPEEALAIYDEGTAWPSSYDEHTLETLERHEPTAEQITDERHLAFCREHNCYLKYEEAAAARATEGVGESKEFEP